MNVPPISKMNQYCDLAVQLMNPTLNREQVLSNCAVGLTSEIGELHEMIYPEAKEFSLYVPPPEDDVTEIVKELGDIAWYSINICHVMQWDPNQFGVGQLDDGITPDVQLHTAICTLVQRGARVAGWIKWHVFHEHPVSAEMVEDMRESIECIFVALKYFAVAYCRTTIKEVLETNLKKLYRRYPSGRFAAADSINRAD